MTALRAFLMLHQPDKNWLISVHRDLESVLDAWKDRASPEVVAGVLHVGFARPPARAFEELIAGYAGHLLLTSAARFSLPQGFDAAATPIGHIELLPIFLATKGWGYLVDEATLSISEKVPAAPEHRPTGWVRGFLEQQSDASGKFVEAGIHDEQSYLAAESSLEFRFRRLSGLYRFKAMMGSGSQDPCEFARAAPPWLSARPVELLDLTVRIAHVFDAIGINTVRDLGKFSLNALLKAQNFGRQSSIDLLAKLEQALDAGPQSEPTQATEFGLLASIRHSLSECSDREREVVSRRMGLNGPAQTLQEIGDDYAVTRERIRQIEAKVLKRMLRRTQWTEQLSSKLKVLLRDREVPMPVLGIEAADAWFTGVAQSRDVLRYSLVNILDGTAGDIVSVDGIDYIAFMTQESWETAIGDAQKLLENAAGKGWTESRCRSMVEVLLPSAAREFGSLIWDKATRFCHFVAEGAQEKVLTTYGRSVESLVEAVLQASETPLHYSEIARLATQRGKREIEVRRAHNAAAEVGWLLGRGTFGLAKHLPLNNDAMNALAVEAEELILDGSADRQWHAHEILAGLVERRSQVARGVDKYIVDVALQRSGDLRRLGRMVWTQSAEASDVARIDIRQAIIAVLQQAGHPLHANDIKQRLIALRGIDSHFQIFAADPLLRTAPGQWGLNDRDFSVKRPSQLALAERLVGELQQRGNGLHISELPDTLASTFPVFGSPTAVFSLASLDPRLRTDTGQYLFLAAWGESRRQSIPEAVASILESAVEAISIDHIMREVEKRVKRPCERSTVSTCLQSLNATFDPETHLWISPSGSTSSNEEEFGVAV